MPEATTEIESGGLKSLPERIFYREEEIGRVLGSLEEKPVAIVEGVIGVGKTSFARELHQQLQQKGKKSYFFDCNRYLSSSPYMRPGAVSALLDFEDFLDEGITESYTLILDNGDTLYGRLALDPNFSAPEFLTRLGNLVSGGNLRLVVIVHKPEKPEDYPRQESLFSLFQKTFSEANSLELSPDLEPQQTLTYLDSFGILDPNLRQAIIGVTGNRWANLKSLVESSLTPEAIGELQKMTPREQGEYLENQLRYSQWWRK